MKGMMHLGKKAKLSPRYVGPYEIMERIGNVANRLDLPLDMSSICLVFHVSMLKKLVGDPSLIMPLKGVDVEENLTYEKVPIEILERQVKRLHNKEIASIKAL